MKILSIKNICYEVEINSLIKKKESKTILDSISFEIQNGETIGIAGESGSGKTSLVKILAGINNYTSGELTFNQNYNFKNVQILFQNSGEVINPLRNVGSMLKEAILINNKKIDLNNILNNLINSLEIKEELLLKKGNELSGGEQQRIALARLLAVNPKILILDEPFSAQDINSVKNFLSLFNKLKNEYKLTFIIVSHDLISLKNIADKILILNKGKVVEFDDKDKIFNNPENSYTKFLLKAGNFQLTLNEIKENLSFEK